MLPETDEQRTEREAELKRLCEEMGLVVSGSVVVAPLASPVAVDASAVDMTNLVACLMLLAHRNGVTQGRNAMRDDLNRLIGSAD